MSIAELIILAIGLSMDSFAVSLGSGALMKRRIAERALKTAVFLASFQAAMPIIGWIAGEKFKSLIESWDHWIAFGVLLVLGGKMIADTFFTKNEKENKVCDCYDDIASTKNDVNRTGKADTTEEGKSVKTSCCPWKTRNLIGLSLATSIDALAVGVSFSMLDMNMTAPTAIIFTVTFIFSVLGIIIGHRFGRNMSCWASLFGGAVLIVIGCKILAEHLLFA
ncbi:MAG: manganese efflux pump MntP family protein [Flavobacteriales bacterium]|nr:manganese efflux pump MntP family protein [Flavobacteriales bacterium]